MPRAKPADRIRKLEEQRARINAEIQRVRSRESQEERKRETRRKILAGAMVLDRVRAGGVGGEALRGRYGSLPGAGAGSGAV